MTNPAWVSLLFGFRQAVPRHTYFSVGVLLFVLALSAAFATYPLDPLTYASPLLSQRLEAIGAYPERLPIVMFV